jgi:molybdopterin/thiamine biosynthesis adenylyltransferase
MSNNNLHENIREQSYDPNSVGRVKYDKATGKFRFTTEAPAVGSSEVIHEAAQEGFAAEANPSGLPSLEQLYGRGCVFEKDNLRDKCVAFLALGSVGAALAEKFAREGLGHFILVDFDRVEPHNLSRHIAGIQDIGRLKTDVVEEAILRKNPFAQIEKYPVNMMENRDLIAEIIAKADLVFCAPDNTDCRYMVAPLAEKAEKTVIYGWAATRAEGVDVFIQRPGEACYGCVAAAGLVTKEEITNEASARESGVIPAYTSAADADAIVQVGLPSDIDPMINLMVKLGLTELTRGEEDSGIEDLGEELRTDNYFIWANRRTRRFLRYNPFNEPKDGPTILRWYGCSIPRIPTCGLCSETNR